MSALHFPPDRGPGFPHTATDWENSAWISLSFAQGSITGDGYDPQAPFIIRGRFDAASGECHWTKTYPGAHDVFYRGFREDKGIWGTWEIQQCARGGFHIWPLGEENAEEVELIEEKPVHEVIAAPQQR